MKTIIALYRRANTGKTTTLNYLIGLLRGQEVEIKERREIVYYGNKKIAVTTPGGKATLLCPFWPSRICSCWSQYYCPL